MENQNLPAVNSEFLTQLGIGIPAPILLDTDAELDAVRKADIALFNASLTVLYAMWGDRKSVV